MNTLLLLSASLITGYLLTTIAIFRTIPVSISNTHYLYTERFKFGDVVFPLFMASTTFAILPFWLSITADNVRFLPFLSCSGMLFVGVAAYYQRHITKAVHYTSAAIWATGAILWLIIYHQAVALIIGSMFGIIGLLSNRFRSVTFFAEVACIVSLIIGLLLEASRYE